MFIGSIIKPHAVGEAPSTAWLNNTLALPNVVKLRKEDLQSDRQIVV